MLDVLSTRKQPKNARTSAGIQEAWQDVSSGSYSQVAKVQLSHFRSISTLGGVCGVKSGTPDSFV